MNYYDVCRGGICVFGEGTGGAIPMGGTGGTCGGYLEQCCPVGMTSCNSVAYQCTDPDGGICVLAEGTGGTVSAGGAGGAG